MCCTRPSCWSEMHSGVTTCRGAVATLQLQAAVSCAAQGRAPCSDHQLRHCTVPNAALCAPCPGLRAAVAVACTTRAYAAQPGWCTSIVFQSRYQLYSINMFVYAVPALYLLVPALASTTSLPGGIVSQVSGAPSCGYDALGSVFSVTSSIEVCLPPVYCNPETCPPALGQCVNGQCQYLSGYKGLATYPHAIATYYCQLDTGGCNGALGGSIFDMATTAASHLHLPLCTPTSTGNCMGIAATSPMLMGNSQIAHDALANGNVPLWGLGLSYVSGVCYELTGPGGQVTVAITDRCAGYCRCDGSVASDQASYHECGQYQCYDSPQMHPNVPCVGTLPQIGFPSCGGFGCASTPVQQCDWCASNNHPHFDLDVYAYNHVCGSAGTAGHCDITGVKIVSCDLGVASPFSASSSTSSSSSGAVPANAFHCGGVPPSPEQPVIPGTSYCCNWGTSPNAQGSCGTSSASPPPASGSPPPSVSAPAASGGSSSSASSPSVPSVSAPAASGGSSSSASSPSVPPPSPPPPGSCPPSATGCSLSSGQGRHVNAPANAFYCGGVSPCREEPLVPGTMFCCQKGTSPTATGACTPSSATTTHASHSFAHAGQQDAGAGLMPAHLNTAMTIGIVASALATTIVALAVFYCWKRRPSTPAVTATLKHAVDFNPAVTAADT